MTSHKWLFNHGRFPLFFKPSAELFILFKIVRSIGGRHIEDSRPVCTRMAMQDVPVTESDVSVTIMLVSIIMEVVPVLKAVPLTHELELEDSALP